MGYGIVEPADLAEAVLVPVFGKFASLYWPLANNSICSSSSSNC